MDRKLLGYSVGAFGLGVLASAMIYPLGYLESETVFKKMLLIGNSLVVLGVFIRPTVKKQS